MTDGTAPGGDGRGERVVPAAVAAGTLALLGIAASIWRPVAGPLPAGVPEQARFDPALLAAVAGNIAPRLVIAPIVTLALVAVPLAFVLTERGRSLAWRISGDRQRAAWRAGAVAAVVAVATSLVTLPASAWIGLVHEARWGFRTSTTLGWARDWLVVNAGRWLALAIGTVVLFAVAARWPRSWPYRLTLVATLAAFVLVVVHPLVLQPLLLRTQPLAPGEVRDAVEDVAAAAGAADVPILVGDASRRTTRVNALVAGLGPTEQIVLFDTLLELETEQIVTVVAHELAHHEHADVLRGTLLTATGALPVLLLLRWVLDRPRTRRRVVATGAPADPRLAVVAIAFLAVVELVGTPVAGAVSRRVEAAADHRSLELGADPATLVRTVRTFVVRDLTDPSPHPVVQGYYGTHPTPTQRIRAAVAEAERTGQRLPTRSELEAAEAAVRHPRAGRP